MIKKYLYLQCFIFVVCCLLACSEKEEKFRSFSVGDIPKQQPDSEPGFVYFGAIPLNYKGTKHSQLLIWGGESVQQFDVFVFYSMPKLYSSKSVGYINEHGGSIEKLVANHVQSVVYSEFGYYFDHGPALTLPLRGDLISAYVASLLEKLRSPVYMVKGLPMKNMLIEANVEILQIALIKR